jgi:hypothetical protein
MSERERDRRKTAGDLRMRPRSSPANFLILVVIGVLGTTAVAAALLGTGVEETTPHGQVLASLQRVADAQEDHHRRTGRFADLLHTLELDLPEGIHVGVSRGGETGWEATASHPVGLLCVQEGRLQQGRAVRDQPVCYTTEGH